jgi:hypothetical protein
MQKKRPPKHQAAASSGLPECRSARQYRPCGRGGTVTTDSLQLGSYCRISITVRRGEAASDNRCCARHGIPCIALLRKECAAAAQRLPRGTRSRFCFSASIGSSQSCHRELRSRGKRRRAIASLSAQTCRLSASYGTRCSPRPFPAIQGVRRPSREKLQKEK